MITIEIWKIIGLSSTILGAFIGAIIALGKIVATQIKNNLDTRFEVLLKQQENNSQDLDKRICNVGKILEKNSDEALRIERELMQLKADLPMHYVRREDFVASHAEIKIRLDALALKIENSLLRGDNHA